jgi:hypothetical protein
LRKSNTEPLGEVFKQYLKAIGAEKKMKEIQIRNNWEEIVGRTFNRYTENIYIKNKILYIKMSSPAAKQELMMIKTEITDKINLEAKETIINSIVLL